MVNYLNITQMASMCGKWFKHVGNRLDMWEIAFQKRLGGHDLDIWKMG